MFSIRKYFLVLSIMLTMLVFLPLVYANLPLYIGSYHVWVLIWGISLFMFIPKVFIQKTMLFVYLLGVYLWFMLQTFWSEMDPWQIKSLWGDYYAMIVAVSIISYFTYTKNYKNLALLTKYTMIFIGITAIMTIIVSMMEPMYSRNISMHEMEKKFSPLYVEQLRRLQSWGAGTRGDGFGFFALIPLLIYHYKSNKNIFLSKTWIWIYIGVCMLALLRMQFATLLIYGFMIFILSLIKPKNRILTFVIFSILILLYIIIPAEVFASFFFRLSDTLQNQKVLSGYLNEIGMYMTLGGGEIEGNAVSGRLDIRYASAWRYIKENPLFGTYFNQRSTYGSLGEAHLFLMNKLTVTGLVGFILWVLPFIVFYKKISINFSKDFKYFFIIVLLAIILYGLVKVIIVRQVWMLIFVIIPGMYYLPLLNKKNNLNENEEGIIHH